MIRGKTIATSGYFNPLHVGHIRLFQAANKLGTYLIVIVNNDYQVRLKGSVPFMPERERLELVQSIEGVDLAVISVDFDKTVCDTLKMFRPHIFAKGGDSEPENTPEESLCRRLGIQLVYGVGGPKIQASSQLIHGAVQKTRTKVC